MDPQSIQIMIESVIGVGTIIAAITAIYSIMELHKQRKATYQPNIIVRSSNPVEIIWETAKEAFEFKYKNPYELDKLSNFDIIVQTSGKTVKWSEEEYGPCIIISLFNIGLGAATTIHVSWSFDYKKFIELIKKITNNNETVIRKTLFMNEGSKIEHFSHKFYPENIDYILPIAVNYKPQLVSVEHFYCRLLAIFMYHYNCANHEESRDWEAFGREIENLPALHMQIEFSDIGNETYTRNYTFNYRSTISTIGRAISINGDLFLID